MLPGNIGIVWNCFEMLHVHVFLVTPLGSRHMQEPCTDQHQGGVPIGERTDHTGSSADFSVQAFNDVVCPDSGPVFVVYEFVHEGQLSVMACIVR